MSFLKEENWGLFKKRFEKHWNLDLKKRFEEILSLMSHWTHTLVGGSENFLSIGQNFGGDVT
jgi:hypothetical protein